ncbi:MAG: glycosyltransferase, partial [Gemmatimonas sp.]
AQAAGDPRVRFTGALPLDDVLTQYETHDVLVLVSETEGWPKVVHEARTFGLRVVTGAALERDMAPAGGSSSLSKRAASAIERAAGQLPPDDAHTPSLDQLHEALANLLRTAWAVCLAPGPELE